ncbi:MAG: hypothetical protein K0S76_1533 [Herbinix sp.]|jgi:hypothetical protein|nr:hypothetical protein [Herbinix sp.]
MQHESKKIAMIVNELLTMLLLKGAGKIEVKINRQKHNTEIVMKQQQCDYDEMFIQNLRYNLNTQRQTEVEEYFWQLVGDDDNEDELPLVGTMVDEAVVELVDGDLYITVNRKN